MERTLDVLFVEARAHRGAVDARVLRSAHVLLARAAQRQRGKKRQQGEREAGGRSERVHGGSIVKGGVGRKRRLIIRDRSRRRSSFILRGGRAGQRTAILSFFEWRRARQRRVPAKNSGHPDAYPKSCIHGAVALDLSPASNSCQSSGHADARSFDNHPAPRAPGAVCLSRLTPSIRCSVERRSRANRSVSPQRRERAQGRS